MTIKNKIFNRLLLIVGMMILLQPAIFAQEADSIRVRQKGWFAGLTFGASQSQISEAGMLSVSALQNSGLSGLTGSAVAGYAFSDYFGISSGIRYLSFNNQVTLNSYQNKFNTTDSENEAYERQVSGTGIIEKQTIGLLGVPVCLNFRIPVGRRAGFSLKTGIDLVVPVEKKYHSSGTLTYKGYYSKYNVLLENLPAYGFPTNALQSADGALDLKPLWLDASASIGVDFFIRKNLQAAIAVNFTQSLSDVQSYSSPDKFQLSTDINQINSMMGGSSKTTLQSTGLEFSLRYYLTRK